MGKSACSLNARARRWKFLAYHADADYQRPTRRQRKAKRRHFRFGLPNSRR